VELTGPLAAALALDGAQANACEQLVASAPLENNGGNVEVEGGRVEEVDEVEVVVPKVLVVPRQKPGGSKSVPSEWNKLAREKKEAERKLADEKEEAERKMSAEKGMAEEQEVEEMMDWPLEGKGKGVVREAVGSPKVTTRGLARRRIKSATFIVDSNDEDEDTDKHGHAVHHGTAQLAHLTDTQTSPFANQLTAVCQCTLFLPKLPCHSVLLHWLC
jgi:hypothetical protein